MESTSARYYEFGEFRVDSKRRILLKNNEQVAVSSRIFDLLLVLVRNEGRILEHKELLDKVWDGMFVEQSNLKKSISALRHTLGEQPNESLYIKTVPRRGYSFISPVRTLPDEESIAFYRATETEITIEEVFEDENELLETPEPKTLPAVQSTNFFTQIKKYRFILAVAAVGLVLTATFFAARRFWAKPTFNYSVENVRAKRLTNEGNLGNAAPISPDGKYIVYPIYFGAQGSLWLRQVQTGSVARLTPMMEAQFWAYTFSPDGDYVYYILNHNGEAAESGLFRIPTLGGAPQKLIDRANGGLTFASDGSRLAFTRRTEDGAYSEVVTAKADGSDLRRAFIVAENKDLWSLRWSPDNTNLLYSIRERGENKLYSYVAETRWDNNSDTAAENFVVPREENQAIISAVWLPDKTGLLLSLRESNADICQLWQYNPATGEKRRITNDDNSYRIINLTQDGKSFSTVQENWQSEVWSADFAALDFHPLLNGKNFGITLWTRDNKLIYEGFENQQATIWTADLEGNARQQLTRGNDGIYLYPSISQNGNYLTYISNRSGSNQIWRIDRDGSNPQQLTQSTRPVNMRSKLLSDNQLLFESHSIQTGWLLQKQTAAGKITFLTKTDTDLWSVSPDEKLLAALFKDEKTNMYKLHIRNLDSEEDLKVLDLDAVRQLSWTRDGKSLIYIVSKPEMDELILQSLDETPPKTLLSTRGERLSSFDTSFDGSKILVVRSRFKFDAFLIKAEGN